MSRHTNIIVIIVIFLIMMAGGVYLFERQRSLTQTVTALKIEQNESKKETQLACSSPVVEKMVTPNQIWRPIQEKVKDTVVQIFAQHAEFDFLQPYKTPEQSPMTGSGFFINEQGDIITNAHVVDQAVAVWIQIPSLGKRILDATIESVCPERDLALLRLVPQDLQLIQQELGKVPFLPLGNSDSIHRSDEVMALGYPLGQQSLKSTTGVISGQEQHFIQMSAAINPGNSGGPLLNVMGEVVGINSAIIPGAQNVGYMIPINDLKIALPDMYKIKLLRKPFLGVLFNNATDSMVSYLGNPQPGGCYIVEVVKGSTLFKAGIQSGDMLYEINGHILDMYGEMSVPWSEDKISITSYVSRLAIGDDIHLTYYRKGKRKEATVKFTQAELPAVRRVFPGYESIDYEVGAGMVVMPLTLNHVQMMGNAASGLAKFTELRYQAEPALIITHIFPSSSLFRARVLTLGSTITEVNDIKVKTLEEYRDALKKSSQTGILIIKAADNMSRLSENLLVVMPFDKILQEELTMSRDFKYPISSLMKELTENSKKKRARTLKMTKKKRFDAVLHEKYPQYSRTQIQSWIMQGKAFIDGHVQTKSGTPIAADTEVTLVVQEPKYVGRAGFKLEHALEHFNINVHGLVALDAGLSTGGFTDCLMQRGAKKIYGVDVGYGQVHEKIRHDSRVVVMERVNLRELKSLDEQVDLVTLDLSFISVLKVMEAVVGLLKDQGKLIVLIKPQFEARREDVGKGGIVKSPRVHEEVIMRIKCGIEEHGFVCKGVTDSPIEGTMGNKEFLAYFERI